MMSAHQEEFFGLRLNDARIKKYEQLIHKYELKINQQNGGPTECEGIEKTILRLNTYKSRLEQLRAERKTLEKE